MAQSYWREKFHTLRSQSPPPLARIPQHDDAAALDARLDHDGRSVTEDTDIQRRGSHHLPGSDTHDTLTRPRSRSRSRSLESLAGSLSSTHSNTSPVPPTSPVLSPSFAFPTAFPVATAPATAAAYRSPRERRTRSLTHPIRRPSTADMPDPVLPITAIPEDLSVTDIPVTQSRPQLPSLLEEKTWSDEHKRVVPDLSHMEKEAARIPNYSAPLSSIEVLETPHDPGTQARMEAFAISNPLLPPAKPGTTAANTVPPPRQPYYRGRSFSETSLPSLSAPLPKLERQRAKRPFFFFFGPPGRGQREIKTTQRPLPPRHRRSQSAGIATSEEEPTASLVVPEVLEADAGVQKKMDPAHLTGEVSGISWDDLTEQPARMK